jgi:phage anti-repressor protein
MDELIPIITNGDVKAVDGKLLHEFLEVGTKFSDWISRRVEKYDFVDGLDYQALTEKKVTAQGNEVEQTNYIISLDMAKEVAMVENNDKGKQARRYFIEVEKKAVALQSAPAPMTQEEMLLNVLTTLQAQVAEQKAIAHEAIKTKAYISDKKVATALNTASQAVKKVNRLEIELDRSQEYRTIKGMELRHKGYKFDWRILKKQSQKMNIAIIPVFDQNYGEVKSYHKDVWESVYPNFF